ncbi:MAG: 8-oxo-dGTP diphosphatase [Candidatus Paceibacterota bacterium]
MKVTTLCLIHEHSKVLLGMKKRGFGMGLWNGFGGKVKSDETIEEAAKREVLEECGIEALAMTEQGVLVFEFQNGEESIEMHIYRIDRHRGDPIETEEMRPQWFDSDKIPFKDMWSDDPYWFPLFLQGKRFKGRIRFDQASGPAHSAVIIEQDIREVE